MVSFFGETNRLYIGTNIRNLLLSVYSKRTSISLLETFSHKSKIFVPPLVRDQFGLKSTIFKSPWDFLSKITSETTGVAGIG